MLGALKYLYLGSEDVDADVTFHTTLLRGELRWFLSRFGSRVAAVRHGDGPDLIFASHEPAGTFLLLFEVEALSVVRTELSAQDIRIEREVETPLGPCLIIEDTTRRRLGLLEVRRPRAAEDAWADPGNTSAVRPRCAGEEK